MMRGDPNSTAPCEQSSEARSACRPEPGALTAQGPAVEGLISIVIPTRNRCALLGRALKSALAQTDERVEVVVVDDASTDDTRNALPRWEAEHDNLRCLRRTTPGGACHARNVGISEARGQWVTFLDDDDRLAPDHVARLRMASCPEDAFVGSSQTMVYADRSVPYALHAGAVDLNALLHYNRFGIQVLVLRERLLCIGGFDVSLPAFQDYDLCVRLVAAYGPALKTADTTYYVTLEGGSDRISGQLERRQAALSRFVDKHGHRMTAEHKRSMTLLSLKQQGRPIGLRQALALAAPGNRWSLLSHLVNTRAPWVQRAYHRARQGS